jgi:N-acylneuraminate cytidylyltransferase
VIENEKSPFKMYIINDDRLVPLFETIDSIEKPYNQARQILPKTYLHNGYLDVFKTKTLLEKNCITGDKIMSFIMDIDEKYDIDTLEQWMEAENSLIK